MCTEIVKSCLPTLTAGVLYKGLPTSGRPGGAQCITSVKIEEKEIFPIFFLLTFHKRQKISGDAVSAVHLILTVLYQEEQRPQSIPDV